MGSEYDFDHNFKYNHDSQVSLTINIPKTCYSKGEFIKGNLYLKTKQYMQEIYLLNPQLSVSFTELHIEGQQESDFDFDDKKDKSKKKSSEAEINLFTYPIDISSYGGSNLLKGLSIPFQIQAPQKCYPSCIFNATTYIRHFLTFDFISIRAKKSAIIIIKNDQYFSLENKLYKSPAVCTREVSKHQYAILNKGSFIASITLPKNSFKYDEIIPFKLEIDCSNLTIQVKTIKVSLNVTQTIKNNKNKKENKSLITKELESKVIPLTLGDKKYNIDDKIQFPITVDNPAIMYKRLDSDKRKFTEKYKNIFLFPTIYNDMLICEYSIKVFLEMNTLFSTNEEMEMPIEFYEDNKMENKNDYINDNDNDNDLPSLEEIEQNQNLQKTLANNNSNLNNQDENNYNNINQTEDYEAPPPTLG